ncbi:ammonium transporter AmtB-like domain-containing protein [Cercophora newfieldiana]|uniref:Ammonium transporter AmtB-like domain-containing protein n=1 Tax=Cercophora newfieldiana TaxID=92897 RepID=A0AA39XS27_9PEZI|nr:ammonium transporter AmtB-like domain-containing protein [Cercophora newfieldiana]
MPTYSIDVIPPQATVLANHSVTEAELRHSPQDYFSGSDVVWVTLCGALVLQMVPAISMFYSGATDRSSTLTLLRLPVITAAFCTVQWYLWGYVLTFSPQPDPMTWTWYGGHTESMVLYQALVRPVGISGFGPGPNIPELLYAFYQGNFAAFTPALICGGVIKKFKVGRFLIFILLWSLLVYYPVARWTWLPGGYSDQHGVMDFAGGTAVHITSGTAVGAVVLFHEMERHGWGIFKRIWEVVWQPNDDVELNAEILRGQDMEMSDMEAGPESRDGPAPPPPAPLPPNGNVAAVNNRGRPVPPNLRRASIPPPAAARNPARAGPVLASDAPHSLNNLVLGTMLLWIGWLGFNGGSALGGNMRAVSACAATHVAASSGACVMLVLFWILKWSGRRWPEAFGRGGSRVAVVHFCDGAVVGLVAITPAAGYVPVWSAGCIGAISAVSIFALKNTVLQDLMRQDPLFVFLLHTGGGFIGMFLTGCFARQYVVGFDGYSKILERSVAERVRWQVTDAFMGFGFTLAMTLAILVVMKLVLRPFTKTGRLLSDNELDELEAELEYRERRDQ